MNDCTFNDNRSGRGGNIFGYFGTSGSITGGDGAGVRNLGTLRATNCTFANNFTASGGTESFSFGPPRVGRFGNGGGIHNFGSLTLNSCTFAFNSAGQPDPFNAYPVGMGAGVYHIGPASSAQVLSTIIARNSSTYRSNNNNVTISNDLSGSFTSFGHNLIGITNGSSGFTAPNDLVSSLVAPLDPVLGMLANNSGSAFTCALLADSPAIDAGDDTVLNSLATDERGFPRLSGTHVDIGAFEAQLPSGSPKLTQVKTAGGAFQFAFTNTPGSIFAVLATTNVGLPWTNWAVLGSATESSTGNFSFTNPVTNIAHRFYRVRSP